MLYSLQLDYWEFGAGSNTWGVDAVRRRQQSKQGCQLDSRLEREAADRDELLTVLQYKIIVRIHTTSQSSLTQAYKSIHFFGGMDRPKLYMLTT